MFSFHKVVLQHVYGVVEMFSVYMLCFTSFEQWQNFENRLTFGKVIAKNKLALFMDTVYKRSRFPLLTLSDFEHTTVVPN